MKTQPPKRRALLTAGLPLLVLAIALASRIPWLGAADAADKSESRPAGELILASELEWAPLNPARGDASPQAATLWGDRAGSPQTGFLVKFADGFSSPPHIHNVTYRGVVIAGQIHNDGPKAEAMWMPAGSFWTQPAGEVHITAARGAENLAYIEIDRGPYLVWPAEKASDNGERPINIHRSNLVWLDAADTRWIGAAESGSDSGGARIAFVWGQPATGETGGALLKLPAGFSGEIRSGNGPLQAVIIAGRPQLRLDGESEAETLSPGSGFRSEDARTHRIQSSAEQASVLYLRSRDRFEVVATASTQ